jgi:hypothetical protein
MSEQELLVMFVRSAMNPRNPDSVAATTILEYRTGEKQLQGAAEGATRVRFGRVLAVNGTQRAPIRPNNQAHIQRLK